MGIEPTYQFLAGTLDLKTTEFYRHDLHRDAISPIPNRPMDCSSGWPIQILPCMTFTCLSTNCSKVRDGVKKIVYEGKPREGEVL